MDEKSKYQKTLVDGLHVAVTVPSQPIVTMSEVYISFVSKK